MLARLEQTPEDTKGVQNVQLSVKTVSEVRWIDNFKEYFKGHVVILHELKWSYCVIARDLANPWLSTVVSH